MPTSILPLASALATAVNETEPQETLALLRAITLASKPLLDEAHDDLGTDLLCLVNYKLDGTVQEREVIFYAERVARDLTDLASAEPAAS